MSVKANQKMTSAISEIKGFIGRPDPGFTPTSLGILLFNAAELNKKTSKSDAMAPRSRRGYKLSYPRNTGSFNRILKSVELLRYKPKYSMNDIGEILGVSSRTIHVYTKKLYDIGFKAFSCMRNRLYRRSKNISRWNKLKHLFRAYIRAEIDLFSLFDALGWDPP